jgi:hypothetical protein
MCYRPLVLLLVVGFVVGFVVAPVAPLCGQATTAEPQVVFLGGSVVRGWNNAGSAAWQQHYGRRGPLNLGIDDDQVTQLLVEIENGSLDNCKPRLIVLQIESEELNGDDGPEQTASQVAAVVQAVRTRLPESRLLVLGAVPRGATADAPERLQITALNRRVSNLADWENVFFLDVGHAMLEADATLAAAVVADDDQLTAEGYRRLADAIEFKVAELLDERAGERVALFDGESLAGWKAGDDDGPPEGWAVADGMLRIVEKGTDAQTEQMFGNFDFQCEWKVDDRSNTGIFYRWASYAGIVSAGPEYQVIDDVGRKLPPELDSSTGATADMYGPPADKPVRPAGQWNHTRIVAVDGQVEHWLNGIRVLTFDMASDDWRKRLAKSKFRRLWPFGRIYEGAFRLQNYGGMPAAFRNITVQAL